MQFTTFRLTKRELVCTYSSLSQNTHTETSNTWSNTSDMIP